MKKLLLILVTAIAFSIPAWAAVDINTATQSQLESLNGVGPKKAQAIIEYRKKNGAFKSVDELDKVPGFGVKTVTKLKKDITVGNAKPAAASKPDKMVKAVKPAAKPTAPAAKPAATPAKDKTTK